MGVALGIASLVVSVFSASEQGRAARKQAKGQEAALVSQEQAQESQQAIAQKSADIKASRARYAAVRQSRIAQARAAQSASTQGVTGGSGIVGGIGSAQTQLAGEVGTSFALQAGAEQQSIFAQQAASAQGRYLAAGAQGAAAQAQWGAIGGVSGSIFQSGGSYKGIAGGNWSLK